MARRWSRAEDRSLRRLYADWVPVKHIAAGLGRSPDAVVARRQALAVAPRRQALAVAPRRRSAPWSPGEDALLLAGASAGLAAPILAGRLHRSTEQVRTRRRMLAASRPAARPYRAHEDEAIRLCLTNGGDLAGLARQLGRTPDAVRLHAQQLGIHRPRPRRRWADWEDALIRDGYTSALSCAQIASHLRHRSPTSVAARAGKLGLATYARRWSSKDDLRLAHLTARGATLEDAAQRLGRTPEAIRSRAARLGVNPPPPAPPPQGSRRWTDEEEQLLRLHHALNPGALAELLGRTDAAVCRRLCALGLRAGAQRSPHHPVRRQEGLPTPGELSAIERELARATPGRRLVILRRFEAPARGPHPRRSTGDYATT